jgi:PIN domain nuclease of toxin-antitoxin system
MKYLLDSHTISWVLLDEGELSKKVKSIIRDLNNDIQVSVIS